MIHPNTSYSQDTTLVQPLRERINYDAEIAAYKMAKAILGHNDLIVLGVEPTDPEGNRLYVTYQPDVPSRVCNAYGNGTGIRRAIAAAERHHQKSFFLPQ